MENTDNKKTLNWVKYAFGEGLMKANGKSLGKFFGNQISAGMASNKIAGTYIILLVESLVQSMGGLLLAIKNKQIIFGNWKNVKGSIMFGIIASLMSFLSIYSFTYPGADLTVATFLISLSIIPSRLIDRFFFNEKLFIRQYLGLGLYIAVAYIFLRDFRSSSALLSMPVWAWLSILTGLLLTFNNLISRKIKSSSGFVHNFWVGLSTALVSILLISLFSGWNLLALLNAKLIIIAAIHGLMTLFMVFFKITAFKMGANLTFEVFIQQSTYLIFVTIIGLIFFNENLTIGKLIGIPGFFIAFTIANQETWEYFKKKIKQ